MDEKTLNLFWMYPDILSLHGERGNIQSFKKTSENLGINLNITRIDQYKDNIDFENADIIMFLPGELKVMPQIVETLEQYKEQLYKYILNNKYIIATGTSMAIFAKQIVRENGEEIKGLGLLDMLITERKSVIGDDIYFNIEETKQEIIGSQIQMIDIELAETKPLGKVNYGYGNNGTMYEGAREKNLLCTNALGPVFVKNPWWTEEIIKNAALNKFLNIRKQEEYDIENASFETTLRFINEKPKSK
jgi:CobQ-like glutamine amidotransferase family enzyme